jgi:hypothetical protein
MRADAVRERHRHLVETDWFEEAVKWAKGETMVEKGVSHADGCNTHITGGIIIVI